MASNLFEQVFHQSIRKFTTDEELIRRLWLDIITHYSNSDRLYHNMSHLDQLADELGQVQQLVADWDLIVLSLAYHDIIYQAGSGENEEKSATHAAFVLAGLLASSQIKKCKEAIMATKEHQYNNDPDINYFTDADLSILGSVPSDYIEYTHKIRNEYMAYPDFIYKPGRKKVIEHFLSMQRIFKTSFFFDLYEQQARQNLQRELDHLRT